MYNSLYYLKCSYLLEVLLTLACCWPQNFWGRYPWLLTLTAPTRIPAIVFFVSLASKVPGKSFQPLLLLNFLNFLQCSCRYGRGQILPNYPLIQTLLLNFWFAFLICITACSLWNCFPGHLLNIINILIC